MKSLLYIFIGGGTGSVLRYLLTIAIQRQTGTAFPWGTFAVNLLGCILIGIFYTLTSRIHITNELRLLLTIGLCGGFTTFSTFSNESLQLLKSGFYPTFLAYVIGSVVLGIIGVMLGVWMSE
ncbi:fluoride efflux transporter CrcB [Phocaeicola massiliensis]|jgi:CrcB protein|uniref:fluoride efflux transporter CrcB n=1 Tax=Phocaeicola massiliensis TaxID=204516 RepID=UPI0015B6BB8D|nr:fluoride efflux transporter CrcB [Phocaeicola massiliensis]